MTAPLINDSIRLPQRELEQLLSDLNRQQPVSTSSKRRTRRWAMAPGKGVLTLTEAAMR